MNQGAGSFCFWSERSRLRDRTIPSSGSSDPVFGIARSSNRTVRLFKQNSPAVWKRWGDCGSALRHI